MAEYVVLPESELAPGSMRSVKAGTKNVVLFRAADGTISALEDRCSHAEVKLSAGKYDGKEVTCPAHGARFDCKTGRHLCMPAVTGVRAYPVVVREGSIVVTLP